MGRQIAPAQLHLVFDGLPPAGEHRLAAVDGKAHPPRPLSPYVYAAGVEISPLTKEVCSDKLALRKGFFQQTKREEVHAMEEYKLFDAEYRLMELVWSLEPVNSTALARRCEAELGWKKSTVFNLIRKLAGRGFLKNEHATVTALVKREQVRQYESAAVVERGFGGSLPAFVAAFLREKKLSPQEADELFKAAEENAKWRYNSYKRLSKENWGAEVTE